MERHPDMQFYDYTKTKAASGIWSGRRGAVVDDAARADDPDLRPVPAGLLRGERLARGGQAREFGEEPRAVARLAAVEGDVHHLVEHRGAQPVLGEVSPQQDHPRSAP